MARKTSPTSDSTANLGFESKRSITADKLRNIMVAEEYKHVVLGLVFPHIYHPACDFDLRVAGFVQSAEFVESHCGGLGDISIYGQESNATTRRLALMNLALCATEADFGPEHAGTFRRDILTAHSRN